MLINFLDTLLEAITLTDRKYLALVVLMSCLHILLVTQNAVVCISKRHEFVPGVLENRGIARPQESTVEGGRGHCFGWFVDVLMSYVFMDISTILS